MNFTLRHLGFVLVVLWVLCVAAGCERPPQTDLPQASSTTKDQPQMAAQKAPTLKFGEPGERAPTRMPAASRIVAIGDIHGDLNAFREALSIAGIVDEEGNWIGAKTVLVQTGDLLDRGDDEPEILAMLERLESQAQAAGGKVVVLNGNHETMNVRGDLRYVTPEGFSDFEAIEGIDTERPGFERVPKEKRARLAAFLPGGPLAKLLSHHNVVAIIGDTVFVHGGVLPGHAEYGIERINEEAEQWMRGDSQTLPQFMQNRELLPPNWVRLYSKDTDEAACQTLDIALEQLGAKRMVVGHTPQPSGINSACDEKVWRIDVGMSAHYGGSPQALEIRGDGLRVLSANNTAE